VVLLQAVLVGILTLVTISSELDRTYESMSAHAATLAKTVAVRWLADEGERGRTVVKGLENFVDSLMQMDQRIAAVIVADTAGRVLAGDVNPRWVTYSEQKSKAEVLDGLLTREIKNRSFKSVTVSINRGARPVGNVRIVFSMAALQAGMSRTILAWILMGLAVTALGVIGAWFLGERITGPILVVAEAMRRVETGDLRPRVAVTSGDEVGRMATTFNTMVEGLAEREFIKTTFSKYVSKQVAERILKDREVLKLEGEKRRVTVLFADMRGFTTLSATLPPEEVFQMLNEYFAVMVNVIFKYNGMLDKFIGDAIMAVWNVPIDLAHHEMRAVLTGLELQQEVALINQRRLAEGRPQVNIGIGINTGEAMAGNIGAAERLDYTVIGAGVNLAQRIESRTQKGQLMISEATYEAVKEWVEVIDMGPVAVKGLDEPVHLYSVIRATRPPELVLEA
jgi:class 3 adenylate cyclase